MRTLHDWRVLYYQIIKLIYMREGSLVVVLSGKYHLINEENKPYVKWLPIADEKTPYTIREHNWCEGEYIVKFEEGVIGIYEPTDRELVFPAEWVREIQSPAEVDIQALMDEAITVTK